MKYFTKTFAINAMFAMCLWMGTTQKVEAQTQSLSRRQTNSLVTQKVELNKWIAFKDPKWTVSINLVSPALAKKDTASKAPVKMVFTEIRVYLQSVESGKLLGGDVTAYTITADENNVLTVAGNQGTNFTLEKKASTAHARAIEYVDMALASNYNGIGQKIKINFK